MITSEPTQKKRKRNRKKKESSKTNFEKMESDNDETLEPIPVQ